MKVVVIGATGTIGRAISKELGQRHEVIAVGHSHGDIQVDISNMKSIEAMYQQVKNIDAVVLATGQVHFGGLLDMTEKEYAIGLSSKLMGQVNVVLEGMKHLNDGGSFTLTSGVLSRDPIQYGSSASMVNGALDAFVKSAALELPRGLRINSVSPTVITESMEGYAPYFRGFESVPAARAALAYSKSVEGLQTGQTYWVV
jgi:NAD(P)-dependent dehydrogenase (short-subunit alcohol dehydrogenase family)